jgi:hypothetical protein
MTRISRAILITLAAVIVALALAIALSREAESETVRHSIRCWRCNARPVEPRMPASCLFGLGSFSGATTPTNAGRWCAAAAVSGIAVNGGIDQMAWIRRAFEAGLNLKPERFTEEYAREIIEEYGADDTFTYLIVDFEARPQYITPGPEHDALEAALMQIQSACPSLAIAFSPVGMTRKLAADYDGAFPAVRHELITFWRPWGGGNRIPIDWAWYGAMVEPLGAWVSPQLCTSGNVPIRAEVLAQVLSYNTATRFCWWGAERVANSTDTSNADRVAALVAQAGGGMAVGAGAGDWRTGPPQYILYGIDAKDADRRVERMLCHAAVVMGRRPVLTTEAMPGEWTGLEALMSAEWPRDRLLQTYLYWFDAGHPQHITAEEYMRRLGEIVKSAP